MTIDGEEFDHIEIFDETGEFVMSIADGEIMKKLNYDVKFCKTEEMFMGIE